MKMQLVIFRRSLIAILLFQLINSINCDLQQVNDHQIDSSIDQEQETSTDLPSTDPEHIKQHLKETVKRRIDLDKNGLVSYEELKKYVAELHDKNIDFNVEQQWRLYSPQIHEVFSWEGYEPETTEVLTWDNYFNQTYPELMGVDVGIPMTREQDSSRILNNPKEIEEKASELKVEKTKQGEAEEDPHLNSLKLMVARADSRWKLADENGDTLLTKNEFKLLLHPDEGFEELQNLFVREATEDMDLDRDGKICLDEFMKHLQILATEQERNDKNWLSSQQENFGRFLDKNKDGILDDTEIRDWLIPPKSRKFEAEAKRLLDIGDVNEDHSLSVAEILEHFEQYLTLLPPEFWQTKTGKGDTELASESNNDHDEL